MSVLLYLIPIALCLGLCWLGVFVWSLRTGQYDDLEGAANRILFDDNETGDRHGEDDIPADDADLVPQTVEKTSEN